jgi:hypothetical protein
LPFRLSTIVYNSKGPVPYVIHRSTVSHLLVIHLLGHTVGLFTIYILFGHKIKICRPIFFNIQNYYFGKTCQKSCIILVFDCACVAGADTGTGGWREAGDAHQGRAAWSPWQPPGQE